MRDAEHLESAGPESVRMKISAEFNGELGVLIDDFIILNLLTVMMTRKYI